jgi:tryptophan-rich sensory protein
MAVAAWLVWDRLHGGAFPALKLFAYQLGLNVLWSILFFALRSPDAAAAEIVVLWLLIGATTFSFLRIHRVAGYLLVPYWIWVTFAAALNYSIAQSN